MDHAVCAPPPFETLRLPSLRENEHLDALQAYFGSLAPAPAFIADDLEFIFICFTNRCGSNYLAALLASGGALPEAGENLNAQTVIEHAETHGFRTFQAYFSFLAASTAHNGRVAIKVTPAHIELLTRTGILPQIIGRSRFVVSERSDKLAQAISHLIASHTGQFTLTGATAGSLPEPVYDQAQLNMIMRDIADTYRDFNLFFSANGIVPGRACYEQLVDDPFRALALLKSSLGLERLEINPGNVRFRRQAGALNTAWRAAYLTGAPYHPA